MSLSRPAFFESHQPEGATAFRDDQQLNGTLNTGKGIISKLKKAASIRRGSVFADSQHLLDSPLLNSPTTPRAISVTETTCLDNIQEDETFEGSGRLRNSVERSSIDYALTHKKSNMLVVPSDIIEEEETEINAEIAEEQREEESDQNEIAEDTNSKFNKRNIPSIKYENVNNQPKKRSSKKGRK